MIFKVKKVVHTNFYQGGYMILWDVHEAFMILILKLHSVEDLLVWCRKLWVGFKTAGGKLRGRDIRHAIMVPIKIVGWNHSYEILGILKRSSA